MLFFYKVGKVQFEVSGVGLKALLKGIQIESILVDVDVENFYRYDQDIPNGDDEVPYFVEWTYNYDLFFTAQIETTDSPIMLIGPVNKEEYELIELTFENPHLF